MNLPRNLAVLALLAAPLLLSCEAGPESGGEGMAKVMCEKFIDDQLKSPGSADYNDEVVTGTEPQYSVSGSVDSENSFGASVRNDFTCEVRYTGDDNWRLVSLSGLTN